MKKKTVVLLIAAAGIIVIHFAFFTFRPYSEAKTLEIPSGWSARRIAQMLREQKIIDSKFYFEFVSFVSGTSSRLKAGVYDFLPGRNIWQVVLLLRSGRVKLFHLTVPDGLTAAETAGVIQKVYAADREKFIKLISDAQFAKTLNVPADSLEGYLYPDTYYFPAGTTEEKIIEMMVKRFFEVNGPLLRNSKGRSGQQVVILASIIEKEAGDAKEKRIISGIFQKRLKKDMKLGSCATVLYTLNQKSPVRITQLYYKNLSVKSPYNTYIHHGLPPGPICSPGRDSIDAVINQVDTRYLYFVSRHDGTHEFTATLEEHLKAKEKWGQP